jgi:tetratricopeptide (TPR) repeat protein
LTGSTRTAVARQRTLEATLDWSYHLLSEQERAALCRLSVFPASWTIDAAEAICEEAGDQAGDTLDVLARLVSKSLVAIDGDGGDRRYRLLETVRQYASERLMQSGAADRVRDRHFAFFREMFREAGRALLGSDQVSWLRRLQTEQENIRAALDWSLSSATLSSQGAELVAALIWFWTKRSLFREGRLWLERAATVNAPPSVRAWLLIGLSRIDYFQGRLTAAEEDSTEAIALVGSEGDPWVLMFAHMMQGHVRFKDGDYDRAAALALQACEDVNLRLSGPLMILGNVARVRGDHEQAQDLYDEAIDSCRRAGDVWALGIVALPAVGLHIARSHFDEAEAVLSEAVSGCRSLNDLRGVAWCVSVFGALEAARGQAETACRLWGAADGLLESVGGSLNPEVGWIRDHYVARTRSAMGDGRFSATFEQGRRLSLDQAFGLIEGYGSRHTRQARRSLDRLA